MGTPKYQERLEALFAKIEQLSANPAVDAHLQRDIKELHASVRDLKADLAQSAKGSNLAYGTSPSSASETSPASLAAEQISFAPRAAPRLYETEQIGYVYTGDSLYALQTPESAASFANGKKVPLTAGAQVIGYLQLQPSSESEWGEEEMALINTVARQVALQIENLRLLEATERARADAEAATRRFIHESWENFLDGIHQSERIGYTYDRSAVKPILGPVKTEDGIVETVNVLDEQVGLIYVRPTARSPLTNEDRALVASVAKQVAQQVENLRLLAESSRLRAEAEAAMRRFTREAWQTYTEQQKRPLAFVYDSNSVMPLSESEQLSSFDLELPLIVRGEIVGRLATKLNEVSPEMRELAAAIAARASVHLELLRLNEELQKRAAELQELDRLKTSFLANMSHELRTPLNSILGFTDVLLEGLDGPLTETMSADLRLIQKNGQHLLHLINDVLDMAKIEAGRMNLVIERFRLGELLDEALSITSSLAAEKNLLLFVEDNSDRETEITADRTRIRQVMLNLINNAIKFTEQGQISIDATRQGEYVLIRVRDTGVGIPADKLDAIFQEFTQVDSSSTRKAGGTGLGLPISRKLVEMHGGRLWAESRGIPGEGSTFYVALPIQARLSEQSAKEQK